MWTFDLEGGLDSFLWSSLNQMQFGLKKTFEHDKYIKPYLCFEQLKQVDYLDLQNDWKGGWGEKHFLRTKIYVGPTFQTLPFTLKSKKSLKYGEVVRGCKITECKTEFCSCKKCKTERTGHEDKTG